MEKQLKIRQLMTEDLARLEELYDKLSTELATLPTGSLSKKDDGIYRSCYENGKQYMVKLNTAENDLLYKLKKRRYITKALPVLNKRKKQCINYLKADKLYDPIKIQSLLPSQYNGLNGLDIFLEDDINIDEWLENDYIQGQMYMENKKYLSAHGLTTRSKSEALIGIRLAESNIPFKYEPSLNLGNNIFYPDFEILLTKRRRIVYWEHFGMIDNPDYVLKMLYKLNEYAKHGIYLGYNLIITFENLSHPLTLADIDDKITELINWDNPHNF